jgi:hypothetical protein
MEQQLNELKGVLSKDSNDEITPVEEYDMRPLVAPERPRTVLAVGTQKSSRVMPTKKGVMRMAAGSA